MELSKIPSDIEKIVVTEEQILTGPWAEFTRQNHQKYLALSERTGIPIDPLTEEDIIKEFITCNWAEEIVNEI